jgi:hypothetical protein
MIGERAPANTDLMKKAPKKAGRLQPSSSPIGVTKTLAPQTPAPLENAPAATAATTMIHP